MSNFTAGKTFTLIFHYTTRDGEINFICNPIFKCVLSKTKWILNKKLTKMWTLLQTKSQRFNYSYIFTWAGSYASNSYFIHKKTCSCVQRALPIITCLLGTFLFHDRNFFLIFMGIFFLIKCVFVFLNESLRKSSSIFSCWWFPKQNWILLQRFKLCAHDPKVGHDPAVGNW